MAGGARPQRIPELDAVRGLAALVVVLSHWAVVLPGWDAPPGSAVFALQHSPLRLLLAGPEAVILFFVLSGFVLALGAGGLRGYAPFLVRRALRLYPALWLALLVAVAGVLVAGGDPVLPGGAAPAVTAHGAVASLADADLLRGGRPALELDGVLWSMVHELRISVVFPLLLAVGALIGPVRLAVAAALVGVWAMRHQLGIVDVTWLSTLAYAGCFATGIALAAHRVRLVALVAARSRGDRAALAVLAVLLVTSPYTLGDRADAFAASGAALVAVTLGAAMLLVLAQAPATRAALAHPLPVFLGRISYSLYLLHSPVRDLLIRTLGGHVPVALLAAGGIAAAVALAALAERFVERPATRMGVRLAGRLTRRRPGSAAPHGAPVAAPA